MDRLDVRLLNNSDLAIEARQMRLAEDRLGKTSAELTRGAKGKETEAERLERLGKLKKSCADIESLFVSTLLKTMRRTAPKSGLLKDQTGGDVYRSIYTEQLSIHLSRSQGQGIGVGQAVFGAMVRRENLEDLDAANPTAGGVRYTRTIPSDQLVKDGAPGAARSFKSPGAASGKSKPVTSFKVGVQ